MINELSNKADNIETVGQEDIDEVVNQKRGGSTTFTNSVAQRIQNQMG